MTLESCWHCDQKQDKAGVWGCEGGQDAGPPEASSYNGVTCVQLGRHTSHSCIPWHGQLEGS